MTINTEVLRAAADAIEAHPESYKQSVWRETGECGTVGCVAYHLSVAEGNPISGAPNGELAGIPPTIADVLYSGSFLPGDNRSMHDFLRVWADDIDAGVDEATAFAKLITSTAGYRGTATAGDYGKAKAGDGGTATAGDYGKAKAGYDGTAKAGYDGTATAGDRGTATAGGGGTATAGDYGKAKAGDGGTATAGDYGTATAGDYGTAKAGDYGTATAGDYGKAKAGYDGLASAGLDGIIQIDRRRIITGYVGENGIKPDTPYKVRDGKLVPASEDSE